MPHEDKDEGHHSRASTMAPPCRTVRSISAVNLVGKSAPARPGVKARSKTPSKKGRLWGSTRLTRRGKSRRSTPVTSATQESRRAATDWPAPTETQRMREELERRRRARKGENTAAEREAAWRDYRCGPLALGAGQGGGGGGRRER
uniref:Uncharacterized protein n=1 Tax=Ananas comosus var. bracteatus TaxID=296719 RepID=A0A6V7PX42_ANACO|nr:unnamed protein product [Ananas comosus var. bracteatus]